MSSSSVVKTVGIPELLEWLVSLGLLEPSGEHLSERGGNGAAEDLDARQKLRDGVALCHLVNKIKPGSVDKVRIEGFC